MTLALQVNYNYDEYDRTIKDAIRGGKNDVFAAPSRPQRDWSRYMFAAAPKRTAASSHHKLCFDDNDSFRAEHSITRSVTTEAQ